MDLIVIIPYYKLRFLAATLASLAEQSDKQFRIWIGDDASPEDPTEVIHGYEARLNVTYHRFAQNCGGRSIVEHWNRCIRASKSEWIWLFADDDTASPDCVGSFREVLKSSESRRDVYRFQTSVIDEEGAFLCQSPANPQFESASDLALCRLLGGREFFVQNHIFSRASFDRCGGLVDLPCGLFSEDAGFASMSRETGVATIPTGRVNWRQSRFNLNAERPELVDQKLAAFMSYVSWVEVTFGNEGFAYRRMLRRGAAKWILSAVPYLGGAPSRRSQIGFYGFFLRFAPWGFPRVFRRTWIQWNQMRSLFAVKVAEGASRSTVF